MAESSVLGSLPIPLDPLIRTIEISAVLVAAISGFAEAQRKNMDVVGVYTVAFITAFGGGTLRDVLLDRRPFIWIAHEEYAIAVFLMSLLAFPVLRIANRLFNEAVVVFADALGLGLFSISGVVIALELGTPLFMSIMMGVITGVFGGILRDVICNEVPMILRDGKPYALCAFLGCWLFWLLMKVGLDRDSALLIGVAAIATMRMVAWRLNISLKPKETP
jgi:uncharacterized membrane protein YeiH